MGDILDDRLREMVARANAGAYIPPLEPTANAVGQKGKRAMATKVSKKEARGFEFRFASGQNRSGAFAAKYPWDEGFGGDLLLIERSEGPENEKGTVVEGTETALRSALMTAGAVFSETDA